MENLIFDGGTTVRNKSKDRHMKKNQWVSIDLLPEAKWTSHV